MKGDFSRSTFDPRKHYSGVRMQQGRVQLDADWNENLDILLHRIESEAIDVIGECGVPVHNAAFGVVTDFDKLSKEEQDWLVGHAFDGLFSWDYFLTQGRAYVDGILVENDHTLPISWQPHILPTGGQPPQPGIYLLYLDVWQRHITALEDPSIREVALGGPDTATRMQTIWQARAKKVGDLGDGITCADDLSPWQDPSKGKLRARTHSEDQPDDPCTVPPGAGYKRLENQLYRVEIHKPSGMSGGPTFKWSRDNGSVVVKIEEFKVDGSATKVRVSSLGRDDVLGLDENDWVEVLDDSLELYGFPGTMAQIVKIDPDNILTLSEGVTIDHLNWHPKIRRWDSEKDIAVTVPADNDGYIELEDGIEIKFDIDTFHTGDYWLIPARTVPGQFGDIQWPQEFDAPAPLLPFGILHHYCKLAVYTVENKDDKTIITVVDDCRKKFPPLTELPAGGESCCSVTVGDGVNSVGDYNDIQEAVSAAGPGGQVCVLPGQYALKDTVVINLDGLTLSGCATRAPILGPSGKPAFIIQAKGVTLEALLVWAQPSLQGVIVVEESANFRLASCQFSHDPTGAGKVDGSLHLVVQHTENVRITGNRFYAGGMWLGGTKNINIDENQLLEAGVWFGAVSEQVEIRHNHLSGGSIWVADYSREVEICDNRIVGSHGPGIILGGLPEASLVIDLPMGSAIQEVTIEGNDIQDALGSGISTTANHGFVGAVFINQNRIVGCAQQAPNKDFDTAAVGGIVLRNVSRVHIHSNHITENGTAKEIPACGIFVHDCSELEITDNTVLNNGTKSVPEGERTTFQAGIVAQFVHSEPGIPAVRVHDNVVICPKGQALIVLGSGAMSITGNTLTSQGVLSQPLPWGSGTAAAISANMLDPIGTCIRIVNLSGTSLPSQSPDKIVDGRVLFHSNQVKNQGLVELQFIPVAVISQDDVSLQDNQFLIETIKGVSLTSVLVMGATVRAGNNRFHDTQAIFSYYSQGDWNIATGNQATHCLQILGPVNQVIDQDNQVLNPVAGICDPAAKDTQLFTSIAYGAVFHQEYAPGISSTDQTFVKIVAPGKG